MRFTFCGTDYISSKEFEMPKSEVSFSDILSNIHLSLSVEAGLPAQMS